MIADLLAVILVALAAPGVTLLAVGIATTTDWRGEPIMRALLVLSVGLAGLIDISLLYQWLGDDYYLRDVVRLTVYLFVVVGVNMLAFEFLRNKVRDWRRQRAERRVEQTDP